MTEESRYRQISRVLRKQIQDGTLERGDRLPSEKELEDRFRASRNTVRLALGVLRNQGLIESHPGRGHFVQSVLPFTYHASRYSGVVEEEIHDTEAAQLGELPRSAVELLIEKATAGVASRLHIDEGTMVAVRRAHRFRNNRPSSVETAYYPMDIARDSELMLPEDLGRGAVSVLQDLGHSQVGHVDELQSRMPSPEEAANLDLPPGVPVLELYRTGFSTQRPIRLTWTVFAGNSTRFQYETGDVSAYHSE
ncbi:GntR family transcriptional regulator [Salinactinospora qingdaonensis]|uniref:GntR family transcriptional regulator n=1 Tax=Salinactinospora qingdaonensis TaxID=702744 RepID=A0ABP7FKM9_9ACTN